jgi:tRNA G10  N-methylase Trm11
MPQYLFILGRNPELSKQEVFCYLKKEGHKILGFNLKSNGFLVEIDNKLKNNAIDRLGGVIAIGEGLCGTRDVELDKAVIYNGASNKLNYVLWNFSDKNYDKVSGYLKKRFKQEELKATEKNLNGSMELQSGERVRIASGLINEEFFVFEDLFGRIIQNCDYKELEERDMEKPVRREELSISPRLAKIMINLSLVKEKEILLDPFCGIGAILIEALMQEIRVVGIDKDEEAIKGCLENLKFKRFNSERYSIITGDSRKVDIGKVDGVVTEPDLGRVLRHVPSLEEANKMLRGFEGLMVSVLNNLKKSVSGRIVFTLPLIKTGKTRVSCNLEKIAKNTGLKIVKGFPIKEYRESNIVGREIIVLENR